MAPTMRGAGSPDNRDATLNFHRASAATIPARSSTPSVP